ncbi:MAG: NAD(P)H-hydrate dehydratase [Opitutae bacterium]|nr:NAD(P)H-hydrate dehydratase [Opitutae bacterium]
MPPLASPPILTCAEALALETRLFAGDESREWPAMQCAGRALSHAVQRDFLELGDFPPTARLLVLVGKGHNGGDALIAAREILTRHPAACADIVFVFGERSLRPLAQRAWQELTHAAPERVRTLAGVSRQTDTNECQWDPAYDLCLDGVFGFQFHPPLDARAAAVLRRANAHPIRLRAAIDLPSGLEQPDAFRADFTYATGSVKTPVLDCANAGRVRFLDLGFFAGEPAVPATADYVLTADMLAPLAALRPAKCDKRSYGHLFVLGGSRSYPGAALMTVLAALRSGAGLVTAFVPESLAPAFAARAPEAMWVGWPETPDGGLSLDGQYLLRERIDRATALVLGPGLGREPETLALALDIVTNARLPLVLDADALQTDIVRAGAAPRILTPHAGEFARIAGATSLRDFCRTTGATVVLKGPVTRLGASDGAAVYHSFFGGPVLARGGSGDLLAGLIGGLLAQQSTEPLTAAARGLVWHGRAAEALARAHGQTAVHTTQLLDFLSAALREEIA